jgi:hypothetical protein
MSSLTVNITSEEKGSLYQLQITPTQLDDSKSIGSYAATLSGVGLEPPLTIKLRKFNRGLGAVKLTSRVLNRLFRKHTDKLATAAPRPTVTKTRIRRTPKVVKEVVKENVPAPAVAAPASEAVPAPARAMAAFQV